MVNCKLSVVTPKELECRGQHHAKPNQCFCLTVCEYRQRVTETDPPHNCDGEFGDPAELAREAKDAGCCGPPKKESMTNA
jgi:hypothetical protein